MYWLRAEMKPPTLLPAGSRSAAGESSGGFIDECNELNVLVKFKEFKGLRELAEGTEFDPSNESIGLSSSSSSSSSMRLAERS